MKNNLFYEKERQRKADRIDEAKASVFAFAIVFFIVTCLIYSLLTK